MSRQLLCLPISHWSRASAGEAAFTALVQAETARWGGIARAANIRVE
jgi:hypothetical protein